ncbi:DUF2977 domain-containing protein [Pediococcus pentosaceus]|uniref:DUF2977 domain-containing protein n=1 Tax=Pediococcus pentosaceus TaxID=1255 RepID=UPI001C92C6E2|nr:DUF2977 domain-containing protein [Pediococcus pentosaceus]MBY4581353.1 DUF2977 domain-containing protein [Pediococcus pentosaceus]
MQLQLDNNNVIIGYANFGEIKNGVEFDENKVPDDFYKKFKSSFYLLKDSEIVENPDYVSPKPPVIGPSTIEQQVAALSYQQMVDNQTINTLQQQNAQMAYQIMTGGNA